jgi:hypothetical protein
LKFIILLLLQFDVVSFTFFIHIIDQKYVLKLMNILYYHLLCHLKKKRMNSDQYWSCYDMLYYFQYITLSWWYNRYVHRCIGFTYINRLFLTSIETILTTFDACFILFVRFDIVVTVVVFIGGMQWNDTKSMEHIKIGKCWLQICFYKWNF